MMKNFALILVFSLALASLLNGQVLPPTLQCVANDSLQWEVPENDCGPFNAYLIYASQNEDGPYDFLAEVTDPNQTVYFHEDAGAGTWYYYMESDYDCPGDSVLQSDTLDNLVPLPGELRSVSVEGSGVRVNWAPSPSPEVVGYILSREVAGQGTQPLDTVFDGTTYLDTGASADEQIETYFLEAIDACGNKSLVSGPHQTILPMVTAVDSCERSISLSWNSYEGWGQAPESYRILVSTQGSDLSQAGGVGGTETTFTYSEEVNDNQEYCFVVVANRANGEAQAVSAQICEEAMVVQAVNQLSALNASVEEGSIRFDWLWNADAAIAEYTIQRRAPDSDVANPLEQVSPVPAPVAENTFLDETADPTAGSYNYQIAVTDECGETTTSNDIQTVYLRARAFSGVNDLQWTPYQNQLAEVNSYQLYRIEGMGEVNIGTFEPGTRVAADEVDLSDSDQILACYYVVAEATVTINDTIVRSITSRSNIACAQQMARIYIPSAFSPNDDGRNDVFRPFLQFGTPVEYTMTIYDRWGGQIFQTKNFDEGWDGETNNGERVPVGPYGFLIRIEQEDGTVIEESGEVALLR